MKSISLKSLLLASTIFGSVATVEATVLDFQIGSSLLFEYSSETFNLYDYYGYTDSTEFENDYPVFSLTDSYDVNGFGEFEYEFVSQFVSPTFDINGVYDWQIDFDFDYLYGYELDGEPAVDAGDSGFFSINETFSVAEITNFLFGATPQEVLNVIEGLPSEGSLDLLLNEFSFLAGSSLDWPYEADISASDILFYSEFGLPYGLLQLAVDAPIADVKNAYFDGISSVSIRAEEVSGVPDAGATGALAFMGLGMLAIVRFRNRK